MQIHTVDGGGGLKLHLREWGRPAGRPILFIHGWSQNHMCWSKQYESPLADEFRLVAMDIRGHGQSEAPLDVESYATGALWADDVRNVIAALEIDRPVLVGWSYGGYIICDYIRSYGDDAIAGVNFVGAAVGIGRKWFGTHIGPVFLDYAPLACSEDQTVALNAVVDFLHGCFARPLAAGDMERAVGWNMLVHPKVRVGLISREDDFTPDLAKMTRPALVSYGAADNVVLPAMAKTILDSVPKFRASEYASVGHAPFIEDPARFNAELGDFVRNGLGAG